jgi:hypothetical protein
MGSDNHEQPASKRRFLGIEKRAGKFIRDFCLKVTKRVLDFHRQVTPHAGRTGKKSPFQAILGSFKSEAQQTANTLLSL